MRAGRSGSERVAAIAVIESRGGNGSSGSMRRGHAGTEKTITGTSATANTQTETTTAATPASHTTLLEVVVVQVERQPVVLELKPYERGQNETNKEHKQHDDLQRQIALFDGRRETRLNHGRVKAANKLRRRNRRYVLLLLLLWWLSHHNRS